MPRRELFEGLREEEILNLPKEAVEQWLRTRWSYQNPKDLQVSKTF